MDLRSSLLSNGVIGNMRRYKVAVSGPVKARYTKMMQTKYRYLVVKGTPFGIDYHLASLKCGN